MNLFEAVLGHETIKQTLLRELDSGRGPSVQLWSGPEGVGKRTLAVALAQRSLCLTKTGCGDCGPCKTIAKNQSPQVLFVEPDGAQIKKNQCDEILEYFHLQSSGGSRFVIIDQVEKLNPQGANSLLKLLEEPPSDAYFILITSNRARILSTIQSRSRKVTFGRLSIEMIARKYGPAVAAASRGSMKEAFQLASAEFRESRKMHVDALKLFIGESDFMASETWRKDLKDRSVALQALATWKGIALDTLQGNTKTTLSPLAVKSLIWLASEIETVENQLVGNMDPILALESFFQRRRQHELD